MTTYPPYYYYHYCRAVKRTFPQAHAFPTVSNLSQPFRIIAIIDHEYPVKDTANYQILSFDDSVETRTPLRPFGVPLLLSLRVLDGERRANVFNVRQITDNLAFLCRSPWRSPNLHQRYSPGPPQWYKRTNSNPWHQQVSLVYIFHIPVLNYKLINKIPTFAKISEYITNDKLVTY